MLILPSERTDDDDPFVARTLASIGQTVTALQSQSAFPQSDPAHDSQNRVTPRKVLIGRECECSRLQGRLAHHIGGLTSSQWKGNQASSNARNSQVYSPTVVSDVSSSQLSALVSWVLPLAIVRCKCAGHSPTDHTAVGRSAILGNPTARGRVSSVSHVGS